jgi:2-polyprenyl-3-methyl-5-hydroxy-6-metoxy-1,4-benzoquinol methylase
MSASYRISHYEFIDRMEKDHFWFTERNHLIRIILARFVKSPKGKRFLEIGCGTGILLPIFESLGFTTTGMDINSEALKYARVKSGARLIRSSLFTFSEREKYDCIGIFDVLEHQKNDLKFLAICRTHLKPGGLLFISVPAHQFLWNHIDDMSGHIRRYSKKYLEDKLGKAGYSIRFSNYWNTLLFGWYLLWRLQYYIVKKTKDVDRYFITPATLINAYCRYVLHIEHMFFFRIPFPFGSSLIIVAANE